MVKCEKCGCTGSDYEMIIVRDELWKGIHDDTSCDFLCRKCIEDHLGRKLTLDDLKFFDSNNEIMMPCNFEICKELNIEGRNLRYFTKDEFQKRFNNIHLLTYYKIMDWYNNVFK